MFAREAVTNTQLGPNSVDFVTSVDERIFVRTTDLTALWEAAKAGRFSEPRPCGPVAELIADSSPHLLYDPTSSRLVMYVVLDEEMALPMAALKVEELELTVKRELGPEYFMDGNAVYRRHSDAAGDFDRVAIFPSEPKTRPEQRMLMGGGAMLQQLLGQLGGGDIAPAPATDQLFKFNPRDLKVTSAEEFSSAVQTASKLLLIYLRAVAEARQQPLPMEKLIIEAPPNVDPAQLMQARMPGRTIMMPLGMPPPLQMGHGTDGEEPPHTMSDLPYMGLKNSLRRGLITEPPVVEFEEIRGQAHAVQEMRNFTARLRLKSEFAQCGSDLEGGIMLVGPAGNGKTTLAKAVAYNAKIPFLLVTPDMITDGLLGASERRIIGMFELAASEAEKSELKHALIFIDEADASVGSRDGFSNSHSRGVIGTLNQVMDGFQNDRFKNVTVIAATNRAPDLDNAIRRRFPMVLQLDNPDQAGRAEILQVRFDLRERNTKRKIYEGVDWAQVAARTDGFSGSDLEDLTNYVCTNVAARTLLVGGKVESVDLVRTPDLLSGLKTFVKISDGARKGMGFHTVQHAGATSSSVPVH